MSDDGLEGLRGILMETLGLVGRLEARVTLLEELQDHACWKPIRCNRCGKPVSAPLPDFLLRAWVECPECVEKQPEHPGG